MTIQTNAEYPNRSLFAGLRARLAAVVEVIAAASQAAACGREAERLLRLSDEELAKRGLSRETVVQHAFRRLLAL